MTTYSYSLKIDDGEYMALEYALKLTISHCELEMSEGPKCPYWAHKHSCESMLTQLRHTKDILLFLADDCNRRESDALESTVRGNKRH